MQEQSPILYCKLKCSIIKDLFSQIMKNTKSSNTFYLNLNRDGIKIIFMEKDKEVEIFICLSKEMFQLYSFSREEPYISKYDIKDLDLIGIIFENQSSILEMVFTHEGLKIWHASQFFGQIVYRIQAHQIIEQIPEEVTSAHMFMASNNDDQHTKIQLSKMKSLSNILHTLSLQKIDSMQFHFKSVNNELQIVPLPDMITSNMPVEDANQVFTLSVKYVNTQMLDHLRFNIKKFKTCLGLFDKKNKIMINFYNNCAKIEVIDKEKKNVEIVLACLADI